MLVHGQIELIVEFEPECDDFTERLKEVSQAQSRVYLLYAKYNQTIQIDFSIRR
jgi:hypothetical protein